MARDQQPLTDAELDEAREAMESQRDEIRAFLSEKLGGEPADYRAEAYFNDRAKEPRPDGGAQNSE